jgi:YD repeat-containing protein
MYNVMKITNAKSESSTYTWDADYESQNFNNQLIRSEDPNGNVTTLTYTALPNGVQQVESIVTPEGDVTTYTYDANSLLQASIDPLGQRTTFAWNGSNQRTKVTDARGNVTTYTYSSLGPVETVKNPLGFVSTFVYDGATGEQIASVDALGRRTTYTYNGLGQQIAMKRSPQDVRRSAGEHHVLQLWGELPARDHYQSARLCHHAALR